MAVIPVRILCTATPDVLAVATSNKNFNRPESDVRPWETVSIVPDDAPMLDGTPSYAPYWVRCTPGLSSSGEVYSASRPNPGDIDFGADGRWIADPSSWDATTGTWTVWGDPNNALVWAAGDIGHVPVFLDYTYSLGREIISVSRLVFTGLEKIVSQFGTPPPEAMGWTISAAIIPGAPGDQPQAFLNWVNLTGDPELSTTLNPNIKIDHGSQDGHVMYGWQQAINSATTTVPLTRLVPCYITLVVDPPNVVVYVSGGSSYTVRTSATSEITPRPTPFTFSLMDSQSADVDAGAMSLLEISLWAKPLSPAEVNEVNAKYTSIYGASVDWD